jgi:hypothetical protein
MNDTDKWRIEYLNYFNKWVDVHGIGTVVNPGEMNYQLMSYTVAIDNMKRYWDHHIQLVGSYDAERWRLVHHATGHVIPGDLL